MRKLKEIREGQLMSQVDLAGASGRSSIAISRYERGVQKPSLQAIRELAAALHIDPLEVEEFQERLSSIQGQAEIEKGNPSQVTEIEPREVPVESPSEPTEEPEPEKGKPGWPLSIFFK